MGMLSVLPNTFHVKLISVVHCHRKIEYTYVLDCVSFIEILAKIATYQVDNLPVVFFRSLAMKLSGILSVLGLGAFFRLFTNLLPMGGS